MNLLEIILVLFLIILISAITFYPQKGLFAKWKRNRKNNEKVLIEDTLKHIYDCEYNSTDCTLNSICGYLSTSHSQSAKILAKLEEADLVKRSGTKIILTEDGKQYALKIIRIHRLWEKHLADNTSVREEDWHNLAELEEHNLTDEEVTRLAAKLGNPLKDPHGDPIPNEEGEIPEPIGIELSQVSEGDLVKICHIEDQPIEIFSKITNLGLFPGMPIKVIEKSSKSIKVISEGEEIEIDSSFVMNIQVIPVGKDEEILEYKDTLSSVAVGEEVSIVSLSKSIRGQQRRRLLDLGIVPGTKVKARLTSLSGDPTAYDVRGTTIALRKNQSDKI
ncbi:MAG: DtxR family transcriptional regulator, partial [Ignavibacteria bacterium]|nr:DtxR family transcriptional regulator [Ignavibacteria bacterium]